MLVILTESRRWLDDEIYLAPRFVEVLGASVGFGMILRTAC